MQSYVTKITWRFLKCWPKEFGRGTAMRKTLLLRYKEIFRHIQFKRASVSWRERLAAQSGFLSPTRIAEPANQAIGETGSSNSKYTRCYGMETRFIRCLEEISMVILPGCRLLSSQLVLRSCCDGIGLLHCTCGGTEGWPSMLAMRGSFCPTKTVKERYMTNQHDAPGTW